MYARITSLVLIVALVATHNQVAAKSFIGDASTSSTATQTTTSESFVLDDPMNSSTSDEPAPNSDEPNAEDICVNCYEKVKLASELVNAHEALVRKQRKLVKRKKAAAEAQAQAQQVRSTAPPSVRQRTLADHSASDEPIVIDVLRVARSAPGDVRNNKDKQPSKKDVDLERLRVTLERQKDTTCKALLELRECCDAVARECIGNLHFHTYELFADQYYGKLLCPYPNLPKVKPIRMRILVPTVEASTRSPVARPSSDPADVRARMNILLPNRTHPPAPVSPPTLTSLFQAPRPPGVILKPTLHSAADQSSLLQSSNPTNHQSPTYLVRDIFSGTRASQYHLIAQHQRQYNVAAGTSENLAHQANIWVNLSKLLLVPCCFAIMVALAALASLRYQRRRLDGDNDSDQVDNVGNARVDKY